ncbi:hypothetical protein [Chryseobacterium sp. EO14]|uniref:hypothetical protein n=2 Tax=Chryseobacterium TaxID=59732 RepID=UPI00210B50AE|nr:hypothetical protein [Chryseobacterium sp. EO14]MCQ4140007.1 hypothetical protein [Chryseobacterium sp. EO14]
MKNNKIAQMDVISKYKILFGKRRVHRTQFKAMSSALPILDGFMVEFRSFHQSESLFNIINLHNLPNKEETHYVTQGMMLARISYEQTFFYQEDAHFYENKECKPDLILPTKDFKEIILEWRKHLQRNLFLEDKNLTLMKNHLDFFYEYKNDIKIYFVKSIQPSYQLSQSLAIFLNNTQPEKLYEIIQYIEMGIETVFESTDSDHQLTLTISKRYSSIQNIYQKEDVYNIFTYQLSEILREWLIHIDYGHFGKLRFT